MISHCVTTIAWLCCGWIANQLYVHRYDVADVFGLGTDFHSTKQVFYNPNWVQFEKTKRSRK